ncbi:MAG: hypothetical protein IJ093_04315 [Bacilli bacterium]|nr:hypothetical protein [Bacilli bacterium]
MKSFKKIFIAFAFFFAFGVANVNAETISVSNEESLKSCITTDKAECKLTEDITLTSSAVINNKDIVLNLNGKNITTTGLAFHVANPKGKLTIKGDGNITADSYAIFAYHEANVVLESGNLKSTKDTAVALGYTTGKTSATFTMNGGTIEAQEVGVLALVDSVFTMNGGTITTKDNFAVGGNGSASYVKEKGITVTINGGTLNGNITSDGYASCGIYFPQVGVLNIKGGTINSSKGAGIVMRGGKLNVTGGTINAKGDSSFVGKVGDSRVVIPVSAIVVDKEAKYSDYKNMETKISGKATINGEKEAITFLAADDDTDANAVLSNGTYNKIVAESYLASGKALYKINDNKYVVDDKATIKADSKIIVAKGTEKSDTISITGADYTSAVIQDTNIATLNNHKVKGIQVGETTITASTNDVYSNEKTTIDVLVYELETDKTTENNENEISKVIENVLSGKEVKGINEETAEAIKEAVERGDTITTEVETNLISESNIDSENKKLFDKTLNSDENIVGYFDIKFLLKVDGDEIGNVTELSKPVTITLDLPSDLKEVAKGYTRNFYVLRIHNGKVDRLSATVKDNKIIFETDKFSNYAITYEDVKANTNSILNPKTGDNVLFFVFTLMLSSGGLILAIKKLETK